MSEKFKKSGRSYVLSDSSVNEYGFRLLTCGYQIESFRKNPIGYYMHRREDGIVLKWEDLHIEDDKVVGTPVINLSHPRGEQTLDEAENGFLNAASVGHIVVLEYSTEKEQMLPGQTGPTITKWYNKECSLVDIPGNCNALTRLYDANENEINLADFSPTANTLVIHSLHTGLCLALAVEEATTQEALLAHVSKLVNEAKRLTQENTALRQEQQLLATQLADVTAEHTQKEIVNELNRALEDRKITVELKARLERDQLNYLQQAYGECVQALARMGGNASGPFVISGMTITNPSLGEYSVTDGWLFYNGEMVHFIADTVTGAAGSLAPFVVISPSSNSLLFNDGSTPPVIMDATATVVAMPVGTPTDPTHFPLLQMQPFGTGFGLANRETGWQSMAVSTIAADGGVTGTIFYKKNFISNTLHLRGSLTSSNAQNFAASPGSAFYLMGTLPPGYAPANAAYFNAQYFLGTLLLDDSGVGWIKQLNGRVNNAGQITLNWLRPTAPVVGYSVNFNDVIPLD